MGVPPPSPGGPSCDVRKESVGIHTRPQAEWHPLSMVLAMLSSEPRIVEGQQGSPPHQGPYHTRASAEQVASLWRRNVLG